MPEKARDRPHFMKNNLRRAIYPGTFDPITFGHIDIIKRAMQIVDYLIIAVAKDNAKNPLFSLDERLELVKQEVLNLNFGERILTEKFEGLLVRSVPPGGRLTHS